MGFEETRCGQFARLSHCIPRFKLWLEHMLDREKVCLHQGSVLNPLMFSVMNVISNEIISFLE